MRVLASVVFIVVLVVGVSAFSSQQAAPATSLTDAGAVTVEELMRFLDINSWKVRANEAAPCNRVEFGFLRGDRNPDRTWRTEVLPGVIRVGFPAKTKSEIEFAVFWQRGTDEHRLVMQGPIGSARAQLPSKEFSNWWFGGFSDAKTGYRVLACKIKDPVLTGRLEDVESFIAIHCVFSNEAEPK